MGADALRYFLLREIVFGQDGSFSYDALIGRYNSDLANGLGNLASRTLTMINQYRHGAIPEGGDGGIIAPLAAQTIATLQNTFEGFEFSKGLEAVWGLISAVDKFIVAMAPWKLAHNKEESAQQQLNATLYTAAEALRIVTALLYPVLPESTCKIWSQLGMPEPIESVRYKTLAWGGLKPGQKIGEIAGVFPRIELKPAVDTMRELEAEVTAAQLALLGKKPEPVEQASEGPAKIPIDDFLKVDLRVGLVLTAQPVKNSNKLMHMTVDIGEPQPRTIVAGIAEAYTAADLVGRKVVIVANLQPRKLKGIESNGMIVAASVNDGKPVLAGFHEDIPAGARLK
jgi:methionyl-tRNA synthetase